MATSTAGSTTLSNTSGTTTQSVPTTSGIATDFVGNGIRLNADQQGLLQKNNPDLYKKLVGGSSSVVDATDLSTSQNVTVPDLPGAQPTQLDNTFDTALLGIESSQQNNASLGSPSQVNDMRSLALQNWADTSRQLAGRAQGEMNIKQQFGVYDLEASAAQAQEKYDQSLIAQRRRLAEMRQNLQGKSWGANEADMANYKYESDQNIADNAMEAYYRKGDYERTVKIAQDAIDAQYKPMEAMLSHWEGLYNMLQNDMTESQKLQYQFKLDIAKDNVAAQRDAKLEATKNAQAAGAPVEVLMAIKNAKTPDEVWKAAGKYGIDPNLQLQKDKFAWDKWYAQYTTGLDEAYRQEQLDIQRQELSLKGRTEAIAKLDAQKAEMKAQAGAVAQLQKMGELVIDARANNIGREGAVGYAQGLDMALTGIKSGAAGGLAGAIAGSFIPAVGNVAGGVGGAAVGFGAGYSYAHDRAGDYKNAIKSIVASQSIQELANMQVKLNPITNHEIELAGSISGKLASSVHIDEETGELTIRGSEEDALKELNKLYDILYVGGDYTVTDPETGEVITKHSNGLIDSAMADLGEKTMTDKDREEINNIQ